MAQAEILVPLLLRIFNFQTVNSKIPVRVHASDFHNALTVDSSSPSARRPKENLVNLKGYRKFSKEVDTRRKIAMASEDNADPTTEVGVEVVEEDWTIVEGGELNGMKRDKGVNSLSSHNTRDVDRWLEMPSLEECASLKKLDLYKNRYIKNLHESVCQLSNLEVLSLVRCEKLIGLPEQIGNLRNLQELDLTDASELTSLPESLGDLSNLRKLTVGGHQGSGNKVLKRLPSTFGNLNSLEILCLDKCKELESLPSDIGNLKSLKVLLMR